jgi:hypothetical protein
MQSRTWAVYLLCVAIGFVISGLAQPRLTGQEKRADLDELRVKFEYKIERNADSKGLNNLGEQGWDLIAVERMQGAGGPTLYLKRSKL